MRARQSTRRQSIKTTLYTYQVVLAQKKARQALHKSRKIVRTSNLWIKHRVVVHGKDESKTKYSASQVTLTNWTNHPRNKQGIQAKKASTKIFIQKEV